MKGEIENILHQEQEALLKLSCLSIEGQPVNGIIKGSFSLESDGRRPVKGKVLVTDPRMKCTPLTFQEEKVEISYCFDAAGPEAGEAISGSFMLITNHGEYEIPYSFTRDKKTITSSMGEIKNLFHFTNLAKSNWEEALKLYFSDSFEEVLKTSDRHCLQMYRGLRGTKNQQFMEEFLQAVNKKKPVSYELQDTELLLSNIQSEYKAEIYIHRKGWGYTFLEVKAEGDFLSVQKEVIRDEDFIGNVHKLVVFIDPKKLHQGKNWGQITLMSPYEIITIPVQIHQNEHHRMRQAIEKRRNVKWLYSRLATVYMGFRSKKIAAARFQKEGEELLEALQKSDDRNPLTKLYGAHLYITQEKYHEAKWLLDRAIKYIHEDKSPVIYAYYLYLTTLIMQDEEYVGEVRDKVELLFYSYDTSWQIAWLYMYLSRELRGNAQKKWNFLMEVFTKGCTSPVMYMEAALLLHYQPTLLMELSEIELRILRFAHKKGLLSEEVKGIIQYLILKEKEYRRGTYELCKAICGEEESQELLQALCSLLIKGNKVGEKYAVWYEKAILANVRLTRLYEYYMMSINPEKEVDVPRMVLMYFSYQKDISQSYGAYLYRYVYENRKQMEELYLSYAPKIERFLLKKLYMGKIDKNLGYLYEHILFPKMITEDNARALAKIMFFHQIPAEDRKMKRLIVTHSQEKEEQIYEVARGLKEVEIFNNSHQLFWEDYKGNRYIEKREDLPVSYLNTKKIAEEVAKWVANERGLALAFCEENNSWQTMNWKTEAQFLFLTGQEQVTEELKKELWCELLDFYYENEAMERLDAMLEEARWDLVPAEGRKKLIHYFVVRDYYEKAYDFIREYDPGQMEPKMLVRIAGFMLLQQQGDEEILSWYIYTAFQKGKYNAIMLQFLVEKFKATSLRMYEVFQAARNFDMETYTLSERLLMQILSTRAEIGEEVELFKDYIAGGAKTNIEAAFLTYRSVAYMRDGRKMDPYLIKDIERVHKRGFRLPTVAFLAYLSFFAENRQLRGEASQELVKEYLQELVVEKELPLPFAQEYADVEGMEYLADKTMLSYKTTPQAKVILHYRIDGKNQFRVFHREEMKEVYFGVFVKEFILFYGEELQYYITEIKENQEHLTKSGSILKEELKEGKKESRYQLINEMSMAESLEDFTSLNELLEEYWIKEFIAEEVFIL